MTKLNISMPQELLDVIDAEAEALGLSRSGLIQEASARYVAGSRLDREAEMHKLRTLSAAKRMREVGTRLGLPATDAASLVASARTSEETRRDC